MDVIEALHRTKNEKALGFDQIPVEVLHNETAIRYLHHLFSKCFETSLAPKLVSIGVISPIPKCNTSDPRDPLSYRGITLASSVYKLYVSILNKRLTKWAGDKKVLADGQNGLDKVGVARIIFLSCQP